LSLHPILLRNVVRITTAGDLLGSGSIVSVRSESGSGQQWPYLVTAHHVVRSQVLIEIDVPDPATDHLQTGISVDEDQWRQPLPDVDLAVAPLGGTVHYLGIFASPDVPMARTATLGAYDVPIDKEENGHRYRYHADLLDCRSYKGFSGSPCLGMLTYAVLDNPAGMPPGVAPNPDGTRPQLVHTASYASFCGILTSHYSDEDSIDAAGVVSRYGVGVMLPAHYIRHALCDETARSERRVWEAEGM
jgi:hypothetical protein